VTTGSTDDDIGTASDAGRHRLDRLVGRPVEQRAIVGSTVACEVRHPYPQTLALTLETPAAVAHANGLLANPASGWRLVSGCSECAWGKVLGCWRCGGR